MRPDREEIRFRLALAAVLRALHYATGSWGGRHGEGLAEVYVAQCLEQPREAVEALAALRLEEFWGVGALASGPIPRLVWAAITHLLGLGRGPLPDALPGLRTVGALARLAASAMGDTDISDIANGGGGYRRERDHGGALPLLGLPRGAADDASRERHDPATPDLGPGLAQGAALDQAVPTEVLPRRRRADHRDEGGVDETPMPPVDEGTAAAPPQRYADPAFFRDGSESETPRLAVGEPLCAGRSYRLEVAVREKRTGLPAESSLEGIPSVGAQDVEVLVAVSALDPNVEVEEPVGRLTLPAVGDSTTSAWFRVRPIAPGRCRLQVRLYYCFNLLERITIRARVVRDAEGVSAAGDNTAAIVIEDSLRHHDYVDLTNVDPRAMHIDVARRGEAYVLQFVLTNAANMTIELSAPVWLAGDDLVSRLTDMRQALEQAALDHGYGAQTGAGVVDFQNTMVRLAEVGGDLRDLLFHPSSHAAATQIDRWLREHPLPADGTVQIALDRSALSFVVPWALLYEGDVDSLAERPGGDWGGFWGLRYRLEVVLPQGVVPPPETIPTRDPVRLAFMLWESFSRASEERAMLQGFADRSGGRLRVGEAITEADGCKQLLAKCDAHVLYFFCHGVTKQPDGDGLGSRFLATVASRLRRTNPDSPERRALEVLRDNLAACLDSEEETCIKLQHGKLRLRDLRRLDLSGSSPLVFLNMCESAQMIPAISESFVRSFVDAGARGVLGTECAISEDFAHPFAQRIFAGLLAGQPLGEVLLATRRHFVQENNPLGLAYTHYGRATLRLEQPLLQP